MIKDYDLIIDYHLGKANVVADALSRTSSTTLAMIKSSHLPLLLEVKTMGVQLEAAVDGVLIASFMVMPTLVNQIRELQKSCERLSRELQKIQIVKTVSYSSRIMVL